MLSLKVFGFFLFAATFDSINAIRCKEGINVTVAGLPFYHWADKDCFGGSNCFTQEIGLGSRVAFRYGGCISTAYSKMFTCEKLFGHESNLNPAVLLDLLTEADDWINRIVQDIQHNVTQEMKQLFSNGGGQEEFVEGAFILYEMMGYNMKEARNLKAPLAKLIEVIMAPDLSTGPMAREKRVQDAKQDLYIALGRLDTKEPKFADAIYSFLGNFIKDPKDMQNIKTSKIYKPAIENLPGLYKSMLSNFQISSWYDVIFKMLAQIDFASPKTSTSNVIMTFKQALNMSEENKKYLDPFLDTIPNFVGRIFRDSGIKNTISWTTEIFKGYGVGNDATTELGTTIANFMGSMVPLESDAKELIASFPGVFYRFFPAKKTDMDKAFNVITDGFKSLNETNKEQTPPMEETKMSEFITSLMETIQPDMHSRNPGQRSKFNKIIINLSKTFYDAMTEKYTDKLNTFFSTLITGFGSFPEIDSGRIITDLVTDLDGDVPDYLQPFLNNMQNIVNSDNTTFDKFFETLFKTVIDYKEAFPESKFPDIAKRCLEFVHQTVALQIEGMICVLFGCSEKDFIQLKLKDLKLLKMFNAVEIDLFFGLLEAAGLDSDEKIQSISVEDKPLATYLKMFRALDPDDVKELLNDYTTWLVNLFEEDDNYNFDNFLFAMNYTTAKIASKLGILMKDLRNVHAPEYCRYLSCGKSLCNTHGSIDAIEPIRKSTLRGEVQPDDKSTEHTPTTTTSGDVTTVPTLLIYSTILCLAKLFV